jgi:proteasome lid subunit RPN8/RPN11
MAVIDNVGPVETRPREARQTLTLTLAQQHAMVAAALAATPVEACGLLVGRGRGVVRVVPTANAAQSTTRYVVAPEDLFAVIRDARRDGLDVIGAFHSHPQDHAVPSATDLAEASPGFDVVIVGLLPTPHVRGWRLVDGNFAELDLVRE